MIYEIVDASDDEMYYPLGYWLSLDDAKEELLSCNEPWELGSDREPEDHFKAEIREHKIGWSGHGKVVFVREWKEIYSEESDEYVWVAVEGERVIR